MMNRHTEAQIIGFLREADAGMPIKELCWLKLMLAATISELPNSAQGARLDRAKSRQGFRH